MHKVSIEDEFIVSGDSSFDQVASGLTSVEGLIDSQSVRCNILQENRNLESFYSWAQRVLFTETPAVLIMDQRRKLVFANCEGYRLLEQGHMIAVDKDGCVCCQDRVAQGFLVNMLTNGNAAFSNEHGSCLIPKTDGWPIVSLTGQDQLGSSDFKKFGFETESHTTLMLRDAGGQNSYQSTYLSVLLNEDLLGVSNRSNVIAGEADLSLMQSCVEEAVSTAIEMKYLKTKMKAERLSELIDLYLKHIS